MAILGLDCYVGNAVTTVTTNINRPETFFVIAKATEGMFYDDKRFDAIKAEVQATPKIFGGYHFAWPLQDVSIEADHFVNRAQPAPGELMALDVEKQNDGATWRQRLDYILKWLRLVKERTGTKALVYCNLYWARNLKVTATTAEWAELGSYPLWLAHYATTPSPGRVVDSTGKDLVAELGWASTSTLGWMHQYSNNINGLDGDWFSGTAADLRALAVPTGGESAMSAEQYQNITAKLDQVLAGQSADDAKLDQILGAVEGLKTALDDTAKLDQILGAVTALGDNAKMDQILETVRSIEALSLDTDLDHTALTEKLESLVSAIESALVDLPPSVVTAVKQGLQGFQINIAFPNT